MPQNIHARLVESDPRNVGQQRIKQFFLQNLTRLRSLSFDEIAAETHTSQPTVTRFVRRLGYENSLDFRAACATHLPDGRLTAAEVQKIAELIWSKDSLLLYGGPAITKAITNFVNLEWSELGPRIQDLNVSPSQNGNEVLLIPALSDLPSDLGLEETFREANEKNNKIIILQVVDFMVEGATEDVLTFSLHLDPQLHRKVLAAYLISAVADIWRFGAKLS